MKRIASLLFAAGVATAPGGASALQIVQVIDDFATSMSVEASGPPEVIDAASVAAPGAIGGRRDFAARKTGGDDELRVRGTVDLAGDDLLRMVVDNGAGGLLQVLWDGSENGGLEENDVLDPSLGGLDFLIYDQIELVATFSNLGGPVLLDFYDASSNIARTMFSVPGGIAPGSDVPLTRALTPGNFTLLGGGTFESILGNVEAILMTIDATQPRASGWAASFERLALTGETSEVPLPAPAALLLLGLGGLGALRLRRRAR